MCAQMMGGWSGWPCCSGLWENRAPGGGREREGRGVEDNLSALPAAEPLLVAVDVMACAYMRVKLHRLRCSCRCGGVSDTAGN